MSPSATPIRASIFDLDGTLLDSLADLADSVNLILASYSFPTHPREAYRDFIGDGVRSLCARALPAESRHAALLDAAVARFQEVYADRWNRLSRPYDGITAVLDQLTSAGVQLAVLSNKPHAFTVACMEHFFAAWRFDLILGQREGVPRKPDAAAALQIAAQLGRRAQECVFVGDSVIDVATGKNAGMRTVAVSWGFRPRQELFSAEPDLLIDRPSDLLQLPFASRPGPVT